MAELADAYGSGPYESNFMQGPVKKTVRWTVFSESVDDILTMNKPQ